MSLTLTSRSPLPCSVGDIQAALGRPDARVLACCVLHNLENDAYETYAVVEGDDGGRYLSVKRREVFLLGPDAPLTPDLLACRPGDYVFCYQVVAVGGSTRSPEPERQSRDGIPPAGEREGTMRRQMREKERVREGAAPSRGRSIIC